MLIIPAIDIKGGQCVRLYQGDYGRVTVFSNDPGEVALRWQTEGALYLHIVDLDGAASGRPMNMMSVFNILETTHMPCELGGGLRDIDAIATAFELGVDRVIVGTTALEHRPTLEEACRLWPGRIVAGIDARGGMVASHGWTHISDRNAVDVALELADTGISRVIYTDIERDGTLTQPNYAATREMVAALKVPVIASGGVATLSHIAELMTTGVEGVIVGRALYEETLDLREAIRLAEGREPC